MKTLCRFHPDIEKRLSSNSPLFLWDGCWIIITEVNNGDKSQSAEIVGDYNQIFWWQEEKNGKLIKGAMIKMNDRMIEIKRHNSNNSNNRQNNTRVIGRMLYFNGKSNPIFSSTK